MTTIRAARHCLHRVLTAHPLPTTPLVLASSSPVTSRSLFLTAHVTRPSRRYLSDRTSVRRQNAQADPEVNPLTLRNGDIPLRAAQLVDPENGRLLPLTPLHRILSTISTETHALTLVQLDPPVVKIIDLEEEKRREREHEVKLRLSRRVAIEDKEVQVGWHAAPGDLAHKAATAKALLEKGDRVHIVFATRANGGGSGTKVTESTNETRKTEIVAVFDEALGHVGKKWKDDEKSKGLWVCYWQPHHSISVEVRQKVIDGQVDKRRVKDEKKEARRRKEEERARKAKERTTR